MDRGGVYGRVQLDREDEGRISGEVLTDRGRMSGGILRDRCIEETSVDGF